jgi:hypothetical protein
VFNPEIIPAIFNDSDSFSEAVEKFISAKTNEKAFRHVTFFGAVLNLWRSAH